jgi:16S rRNA (guanine966-N2)-methyltransferase
VKQPQARQGQLRIIAGEWRSRRFSFTEQPGLRPTPDRVRETLFNWLAGRIEGSRCLDLFTGSGALTLEALSRGAAVVLACDASRDVVQTLRGHLATLGCERGEIRQQDALQLLATPPEAPFEIAFLDPPFRQDLLGSACTALEEHGWLTADAWVYTESELPPDRQTVPPTWHLHRDKRAGQVWYCLWQRRS